MAYNLTGYTNYIYIAIVLIIGLALLTLRRIAKGSTLTYRIALICAGVLISTFALELFGVSLESSFVDSLQMILLVILLFEFTLRITSESASISKKSMLTYIAVFFITIIIVTIASLIFLHLDFINSLVLALGLSIVEYFIVDELRAEGDVINPLVILMTFLSLALYQFLSSGMNILGFLQYIIIGLGTGIFLGIITAYAIRGKRINFIQEMGLLSIAIIAYILAEYINGSGILAVFCAGIILGSSHARKLAFTETFSGKIFKPLETLILLLLGFFIVKNFDKDLMIISLAVFGGILIIRAIVMSLIYKEYSASNIFIMTISPKGIALASIMMILADYAFISYKIINIMFYVLLFSLVMCRIYSYFEEQKIKYLDAMYEVITRIKTKVHMHSKTDTKK